MSDTGVPGRARVVVAVQLLLGVAVLVLAGIAFAGAEGAPQVALVVLAASLGLSQLVPAMVAGWLLRRGRARIGLFASGAAAFVPGAVITLLAVSSFRASVVLIIGPVGALLMGLGFHQLWVRSRVP